MAENQEVITTTENEVDNTVSASISMENTSTVTNEDKTEIEKARDLNDPKATVKDRFFSKLDITSGTVMLKKSKEILDLIRNGNKTLADLSIGDEVDEETYKHLVSAVTMGDMIASATNEGTQTISDTIIDIIDVQYDDDTIVSIPVSTIKASNDASSLINEDSAMDVLIFSSERHNRTATAGLLPQARAKMVSKNKLKRSRSTSIDGDKVHKSIPASDFNISGSIDLDKVSDETWSQILQIQNDAIGFSNYLAKRALVNYASKPEDIRRKVYQLILKVSNKSIFKHKYEAFWAMEKQHDLTADEYAEFNAFWRRIDTYVNQELTMANLTPITYKVGFSMLRVSLSKRMIWTNASKANRVKKNAAGTYKVSQSQDTGTRAIAVLPNDSGLIDSASKLLIPAANAVIDNCVRETFGMSKIKVPYQPLNSKLILNEEIDVLSELNLRSDDEYELLTVLDKMYTDAFKTAFAKEQYDNIRQTTNDVATAIRALQENN